MGNGTMAIAPRTSVLSGTPPFSKALMVSWCWYYCHTADCVMQNQCQLLYPLHQGFDDSMWSTTERIMVKVRASHKVGFRFTQRESCSCLEDLTQEPKVTPGATHFSRRKYRSPAYANICQLVRSGSISPISPETSPSSIYRKSPTTSNQFTNLCAGDEGCSHENGDLGEVQVPVQAKVEQGVHKVNLFRNSGRAKKRKGTPAETIAELPLLAVCVA